MPRHHLIQDYLDDLRALPAEVVDELADGLLETYDRYRTLGHPPDDAARAAITEFGTAQQIVAAFDQTTPGRRTSRLLLATGPLVGACWGTALVTARVWTWPIPAWAPPALGATLLTVIVLLLRASRAPWVRARRAASVGVGGLTLLDTVMIVSAVTAAPAMATRHRVHRRPWEGRLLRPVVAEPVPGQARLRPSGLPPMKPAITIRVDSWQPAEAPLCGRFVEVFPCPLDDHQRAAGHEQVAYLVERCVRVGDVVKGQAGDDGVHRPVRMVFLERNPVVRRAVGCLRIDTDRVVPGVVQSGKVPAVIATAEFDDAARRSREVRSYKGPCRAQPYILGRHQASVGPVRTMSWALVHGGDTGPSPAHTVGGRAALGLARKAPRIAPGTRARPQARVELAPTCSAFVSPGRRARISPSGTAQTTASARRWPASSCTPYSPPHPAVPAMCLAAALRRPADR